MAEKWEMMVNRRSDRHLLSLSYGSRRVVAEEAANWFRRAADEVAILKRLFFGRRPLCHDCVAHAATVDKRPGGLTALCVMYTRRLVGPLGLPWFGTERAGNIG